MHDLRGSTVLNLALLITYLKIKGGEILVLQIRVLRKMGGGEELNLL